MGRPGRFVGVGIDVYDSHEPLEHAVAEVTAVAEVLGAEFVGEPLLDPDRAQVMNYLEAVAGCQDTGSLVMLWCGHGVQSGSMLRLATRDAGREINASEVIHHCVKSGANQLLFIVDTCQAEAGVGEATAVASALLKEVPPDAQHVWFGIVVSCSAADIGARDGVFCEVLLRLLREGPRSPDMRRRWSRHNRLIRGDDLGQALLEDWTEEDQRPDFLRRGSAWYMVPNPLWDQGAPEEVVEHLLLAARGGDSADHRSWFTGREAEVNEVVSWVTARATGVRVVTGAAGTGKSAIVGRVVSLSNPAERRRLEHGGARWVHADPGERSVAAHVHARGLTTDRMAELLDGQLVRSGVLAPGDGDRRNAAELVGALQRAVQGGARPPVLVVDGVDEARGEMFTIAADLLVRLAPYASLVVSTRPVTRTQLPTSLIEALEADAVLSLDDPLHRESGRAALRGYVVARLSGVAVGMDPTVVADRLLSGASQGEDRPFLLARVVTDQLRAAPIDTSTPNWEQYLAHSIESAFDVDLARVAPPGFGLPPATSPAGLARAMLTALTWAFGAGFPEEEWIAVASRLAGVELGRDHVSWVLEGLGRYVVQGGEGGTAVYRVAHQSLADHLRPPYRRSGERPFDPAAEPVWAALAGRYAALIASGLPATAPTYLGRYAYRHAAAVGVGGLPALRELASAVVELRPDTALAALEVARVLATWGCHADAVVPTEEAVALYRNLAADNPAYAPDLAMALNNLGACYSGVGRRAEAVAATEEAVALRREQAADNPAYAPDLAMALNNLGACYRGVGCRAEAVAPVEKAVALYRNLAADNPAYAPDLARALNNLGNCYREVGRRAGAVAPTEEAVALRREQAADNPAYAPDLAMALNNLGLCYREVGRRAEAVAPTEEAVALHRNLAADNPAYAPDLATALNNLGACYSGVGCRAEAVAPIEEAVALHRNLAADNPAYAPNLAGALNNLGNCYREVGHRAEAMAPTEEAVALYRNLAADNPAYAPDLAMALNNLGACYSGVGRRAEAVAPIEEAVALYRNLAADNPAYAPNLAGTLNNLSNCYREVGQRAEAMAPTEEAVGLYRQLTAANPAYTPDLAGALTNLGICYGEVGRRADALWRQILGEHDPLTRSTLLLYRASAADPGDPRTAAWLVEVCRSDDRGLLGPAHETARTHRAANPKNWDAAWTLASGGQPPEWLTVETDLLAVATAWIDTPTYDDEHDHLAAHLELLDPHADTAIEEALLRVDENDADRYRQLRARARAEGVDAAYRPLLLRLLADQFSMASPAGQRELLTERRPDLLDDLVRHHLDSRARADETAEVTRAAALLDIAAHDADGSILTATFDALDHPSDFPGLLDQAARDTESVATALQPLATIALTAATTEPEAAVAGLYLAVAAAVAGDQDRATEFIGQALAWDPGSASTWIARLAQLGAAQPSVLPLITVLAEASHDGEH
jgi:tetratricopeptide (TPR) repeat protein